MDAKGRLSVPAFIRQKIERRSDEKLIVLAKHKVLPCLVGYDSNYVPDVAVRPTDDSDLLSPDLSEEERDAAELRRAMAEVDAFAGVYSNPADVPYDPSGRIIMPGRLKKRAQIDDLAMFIGAKETFMVWNPRIAISAGSRQLAELAADLLEDKGVSL